MTLLRTIVDEVGSDAAELVEGGVLILFAVGAPPELAEVSVTHRVEAASTDAPRPGDRLTIGQTHFAITAVGATAWDKIVDIGHVVFSFTGADVADRPGEICVEPSETSLIALLRPGALIEIARA